MVEGETGFLVPPSDPEALAAALVRLAAVPETRLRMGAAGRQRIIERYSEARITRDYERLYEEMAGKRCES